MVVRVVVCCCSVKISDVCNKKSINFPTKKVLLLTGNSCQLRESETHIFTTQKAKKESANGDYFVACFYTTDEFCLRILRQISTNIE